MEKAIVLGPEAQLKMSIVAGVVRLEINYTGKQASAGTYVLLSVDQYLELLKKAIPGTVDDIVIDGLEAAMKVLT